MKKIMFNDQYGLTQAVLEGKKTMTRRIIPLCKNDLNFLKIAERGEWLFSSRICLDGAYPAYNVGDELAVAQSYKNDDVLTYNAYNEDGTAREDGFLRHKEMLGSNGYRNKMFVKAEYMPHRIRITNIKAERLQDITEPDCIKEGLLVGEQEPRMYGFKLPKGTVLSFLTPREAFAALIDRISGRGTWERNPWVFAYEFELLR